MEISDEKRREVAQKLRSLDEYIDGMPSMCTKQEHDALALRAIRAVIGKGDIFHLLADLIDRPTCRLDHTDTEPATDGYPVRLYECSKCGRTCDEIYGEYEYCPHCGAEVVE